MLPTTKLYENITKAEEAKCAVGEDEVDFHNIAFVKSHKNNRLCQLEGDRKRPVSLGPLAADQDVLSENGLNVLRDMMGQGGGNVNFSLMALVEA